ncbi:MAG: transposase [Chloroflexi bacterium]|nr:transposase [Chloroflexota bacterium]
MLEASGGYEQIVLATLPAVGLPVVRVNPCQTHDFARALGTLAKTDRIDARMLARLAAEVRPAWCPQPSKAEGRLQTLVRRRHRLVKTRVTEQLQRPQLDPEELAGSDELLALVTRLIRQADRDLALT